MIINKKNITRSKKTSDKPRLAQRTTSLISREKAGLKTFNFVRLFFFYQSLNSSLSVSFFSLMCKNVSSIYIAGRQPLALKACFHYVHEMKYSLFLLLTFLLFLELKHEKKYKTQ